MFTSWQCLLISHIALVSNARIHSLEALTKEFDFEPSPTGFLVAGAFERGDEMDADFWLCFDYTLDKQGFNKSFLPLINKPYPEAECSGPPTTPTNYWFALKGHWFKNGSLVVDFVNTLDHKLGSMIWPSNEQHIAWKMAVESQKASPSTVYFNGLANVEIPSIDASSNVHIRLPSNGEAIILSVSSQLNPVILDQLPNYHLLSQILHGDETVLAPTLAH